MGLEQLALIKKLQKVWKKYIRKDEIKHGYNFVINTDVNGLMCID